MGPMKSFDLWKKESAKRRFFFRRVVRSNPLKTIKNEIKTVCFVRLSLSLTKKKKKKKEEAHFDHTHKNYRKSSSFRLNTVGKSEERKVVVDRRNGRERERERLYIK